MRILRILLRWYGRGLLLVGGRVARGGLAVSRARGFFQIGFLLLGLCHRHRCRGLFCIFVRGVLRGGGGIAVFRNYRGLRGAGGLAFSVVIAQVVVGSVTTTGHGCEKQGDA